MEQDAERPAGVRQSSTDDKRAEGFEASARTAEALADTVEKSADVHEEMAATDPGAREHAARDRALAEAERRAAAAYRSGQVPPDDVRRVIRESRPSSEQ